MMHPVAFVQQVREELAKVSWPKRANAINMTLVVLGVSLVVGLYIGGLDSLFTTLLNALLKQ